MTLVGQHDVGRFDVAVYDILHMRMIQCITHSTDQFYRVLFIDMLIFEHLPQCASRNIFHDDIR